MDKKYISWVFIIAGALATFFPEWQGIFYSSADITAGDSRIIGMIALVGGVLLYYLPSKGN